ncbi:Integral membrane sensor domain MASE1 [Actinopolymorpha singaporensis]|uniref:Integral membrane sensor domain MASE1 n=1 Tax=Actinopolymorpha singaporensis TaxID=117157 RepID=A0A1H1T1N2_9ACTN|nr:Integral membrane sensor domain MASE1 [Actinopolymorpha singaporensis]
MVLLNLALAAAYYGTAQIGLMIGLAHGHISPFWPPTGVAIVALLVLGSELWPGILLGAGVGNVFTGPVITAVPTAAGTTLACLCAYWGLRKANFRIELDRLKDALALVFLAAFGAMLISSTLGTMQLLLTGVVSGHSFVPTWLTWWTGDAMGVLIVAPLLLTLINIPWRQYRYVDSGRFTEIALLLVGSFGIMVFGEQGLGVSFLAFPLLVLAAWRFQLPGAAPVSLLLSAVAIHAAVHGTGTFAGHDQLHTMVILQAFNGSIALTGLLLSVAITERNRTRVELERTCARLGEVIEHIDRAMRPDRAASPLRHWAEEKQATPKGRG